MALKQWALALSGGGILGFAHIGVLMGLESHCLYPKMLAGTSAGALVAGLYAAGIDLTGIEANTLALFDSRGAAQVLSLDSVISFTAETTVHSLGLKGIISGNFLETYLHDLTNGKRLTEVDIPLSIVAVDIETGDEVVFTNEPPHPKPKGKQKVYVTDATLAEAIRASVSLPGVFVPKHFRGRFLVDGGVKNMAPVDEPKRMGFEEVVAVDLGLRLEHPERARNLVSIVARSFSLACRGETKRNINLHATVILQPEVSDIGIPTPAKIKALIEAGKLCVEENVKRLTSLLL